MVNKYKGKYREYQKEWRRNNKDKISKSRGRWKEKNPEYPVKFWNKFKNEEKYKEAREIKRKRDRERMKIWRKMHPKENYFQFHKWEIRKKGNSGSHTLGEWETLKAQYNWTCPFCKKAEPKIKLTEDHIIPLSKGGSDNIENIQPLCLICNCKKYNKIKVEVHKTV